MSATPIKTYIRPRQHIESVRFPYYSDSLQVRVIHGVGFRCSCDCGDDSGIVASYDMARGWGREHKRIHRLMIGG